MSNDDPISSSDPIGQLASHAELFAEEPRYRPDRKSKVTAPDAIVMPTSRDPRKLRSALELSAELQVRLVVLCSKQSNSQEVVDLTASIPGCRVLAVDVPENYLHRALPTPESSFTFVEANAGRSSDLSVKRNLGLLLARRHGWHKIMFLDDDIACSSNTPDSSIDRAVLDRVAKRLDTHQIAGLRCLDFPDNSVACHARRLGGFSQDNFITGAALGVNCDDQPLPFFPDVYNEDWFFFSRHAAAREVALIGEAVQQAYDPYLDPRRAQQEEFGDFLAEGLFALFARQRQEMSFDDRLRQAHTTFWESFFWARMDNLGETITALERQVCPGDDESSQAKALASVRAAKRQLTDVITPEACVDFLKKWQHDQEVWQHETTPMQPVQTTAEAMDSLGLDAWSLVTLQGRKRVVRSGTSSSVARHSAFV